MALWWVGQKIGFRLVSHNSATFIPSFPLCHTYRKPGRGRGLRSEKRPHASKLKIADKKPLLVFTTLHEMKTRSSDENVVCLSVSTSVKRVDCDKT